MKVLSTVVLLVALAPVVGACGKNVPTGSGGGGGKAPVETYGKSACGTCVQGACTDFFTACGSDPDCEAYAQCLLGCPVTADGDADPTCVSSCPGGGSNAARKAISDVEVCRAHNASTCTACPQPATKYQDPLLNQMCPNGTTETQPCPICEDQRCCDSYQVEHSNPEAVALLNCEKACPSMNSAPCVEQCVTAHPSGSDDIGQLLACMEVICVDACSNTTPVPYQRCIADVCGDEYATLLTTPGGYAMTACIQNCPIDDTVCDSKCYDAYPQAYAVYYPFAECVIVGCNLH